mmetsp:Transcript_84917/g.274495  ORF Transcript_84917/g.274495 Transcript_84917/m.274495 type:complete len:202 (-) Transcript_84917:120-725(-)
MRRWLRCEIRSEHSGSMSCASSCSCSALHAAFFLVARDELLVLDGPCPTSGVAVATRSSCTLPHSAVGASASASSLAASSSSPVSSSTSCFGCSAINTFVYDGFLEPSASPLLHSFSASPLSSVTTIQSAFSSSLASQSVQPLGGALFLPPWPPVLVAGHVRRLRAATLTSGKSALLSVGASVCSLLREAPTRSKIAIARM